jgi:hypothetical protein
LDGQISSQQIGRYASVDQLRTFAQQAFGDIAIGRRITLEYEQIQMGWSLASYAAGLREEVTLYLWPTTVWHDDSSLDDDTESDRTRSASNSDGSDNMEQDREEHYSVVVTLKLDGRSVDCTVCWHGLTDQCWIAARKAFGNEVDERRFSTTRCDIRRGWLISTYDFNWYDGVIIDLVI